MAIMIPNAGSYLPPLANLQIAELEDRYHQLGKARWMPCAILYFLFHLISFRCIFSWYSVLRRPFLSFTLVTRPSSSVYEIDNGRPCRQGSERREKL